MSDDDKNAPFYVEDGDEKIVRFTAPVRGKRVTFRITLTPNKRLGEDGINLSLRPEEAEDIKAITGMPDVSQNERDFALLHTIFRLLVPRKVPAINRWEDLEDE